MSKVTAVMAAVMLVASAAAPSSAQPVPASPQAASPQEVAACELAMAYDILTRHGILDGAGHISMRSPVRADRIYMSKTLAASAVRPSGLQEFDLNGNVVHEDGSLTPSTEANNERFIHFAMYRARPDVGAVIHSHARDSIIFSVSPVPMRAITNMAGFIGTGVPVFEADPDGNNPSLLVTNNAIGDRLAAKLGRSETVLIRGHGDVMVGPSLPAAITRALDGRKNAQMLLEASRLGGEVSGLTEKEASTLLKSDVAAPKYRVNAWNRLVAAEVAAGAAPCPK
jgi:ribulose-5-phosphate 4-epimerase/fuculose-1-phosphate aldolase